MISSLFKLISRIALPKIIVVGIDIQDRHLFGVATLRIRGITKIVASGSYELSEDAIEGGELRRSEMIQAAIQSLLASIPGSRWHTSHEPIFVLSLPPQHLYSEVAFFPVADDRELEEAVHLKLETSLPWPVQDSYVDTGAIKKKSGDERGVFIAAIAKPILDQYLRPFFLHGWRVGAAEFHLFSLVRFIAPHYAKSFIFILIDEDGIEFAAFAFQTIMLHYLQPIGEGDNIQALIEGKVRQLVTNLEGQYGEKIERIFIFDKVSWEKTSSSITNITGIPTQLFTPEPTIDSRLSVAYGASLRPYSAHESLVNLLPKSLGGRYQENLLSRTIRFWVYIFVIWGATFVVASLLLLTFLSNEEKVLTRESFAYKGSLEQQKIFAAPLIKKADYFNALARAVLESASLRSRFGKKMEVILNHAEKAGLTTSYMRIEKNNTFALRLTAPTRQAAVVFQDELNATGLLASPLQIPITQLAADKDLLLSLSLQL